MTQGVAKKPVRTGLAWLQLFFFMTRGFAKKLVSHGYNWFLIMTREFAKKPVTTTFDRFTAHSRLGGFNHSSSFHNFFMQMRKYLIYFIATTTECLWVKKINGLNKVRSSIGKPTFFRCDKEDMNKEKKEVENTWFGQPKYWALNKTVKYAVWYKIWFVLHFLTCMEHIGNKLVPCSVKELLVAPSSIISLQHFTNTVMFSCPDVVHQT